MKKTRKITLRSYKIQLKNGNWVKVREVLPYKKDGRFKPDFLGAYYPAKGVIEILPKKIMYDIVLGHEARHALSPFWKLSNLILGWRTRTLGPLFLGIVYLYSTIFGLAWSTPMLAYAWGLSTSLVMMGFLMPLEEWRNRRLDRRQAFAIIRESL